MIEKWQPYYFFVKYYFTCALNVVVEHSGSLGNITVHSKCMALNVDLYQMCVLHKQLFYAHGKYTFEQ